MNFSKLKVYKKQTERYVIKKEFPLTEVDEIMMNKKVINGLFKLCLCSMFTKTVNNNGYRKCEQNYVESHRSGQF